MAQAGRGEGGRRGSSLAHAHSQLTTHSSPFDALAPLPIQAKSEARWRDYAADHYYHYYYRYGEDEKGAPLAEGHRNDDLLELAAVSNGLNPGHFVCPMCLVC